MDEEDLNEDLEKDPEEDLTNEVGYKLDEDFGDDDDESNAQHQASKGYDGNGSNANCDSTDGSVNEDEEFDIKDTNDDSHDMDNLDGTDMGDDIDTDSTETVDVPVDAWAEAATKIDELSALFDQLAGDTGEDELEIEPSDDEDFAIGSDTDGEFSDVPMGDKKFGESYKMKPVPEVQKTEKEVGNKKSPVASNAKSPVEGAAPVRIKNGSVEVTDDKFENSDALKAKVDNNDNVMTSAKGMMKTVAVPKNTSEKSTSPVAKRK